MIITINTIIIVTVILTITILLIAIIIVIQLMRIVITTCMPKQQKPRTASTLGQPHALASTVSFIIPLIITMMAMIIMRRLCRRGRQHGLLQRVALNPKP